MNTESTKEYARLTEAREKQIRWKQWGPYLSERQWGTVREDYSEDGNAWAYFPHDHARSRAYHWGEDGIAGFSDDKQRLCFALALWNGKDPIIKERLFGLTNSEGNHGEDVKEYYYYLDSTPTHSYMKMLYKYPHNAYPYDNIVATNKARTPREPEYELLNTGVFNDDRYFDVFVEYAKESPQTTLVKISVANRGREAAAVHVLPHLWFRNTWTWWKNDKKPVLREQQAGKDYRVIAAQHELLGSRYLYCEGAGDLLFTENETNIERLFAHPNNSAFVKDGINNYFVHGRKDEVNPQKTGTKAAAHWLLNVPAGQTVTVRLRLTDESPDKNKTPFGKNFEDAFTSRIKEADEFYQSLTPASCNEDEARVMRQALAGMLWSKQYFFYDISKWLEERKANPVLMQKNASRNREWFHMLNDHVISMPDKWEYPWYAAWDLAFHCIALSMVDSDFAREQLDLMLSEGYLHPSGQIPAYEWNFSDVNPPVHAWATLFLHRTDDAFGNADIDFLKRSFTKLMLNFTWWVNRKDRFGKNVFEGGFLGLDNIGIFDRSAPLPTGGYLEQADGTAWMALFCQNMIELSVELAAQDPSYEDMCLKFMEHFVWIAAALNRQGGEGMWDEEDGFYYDILVRPDGKTERLKVRSMVGLLPLCAAVVIEPWQRERVAGAVNMWRERLNRMPVLKEYFHATGPGSFGYGDRGIIALVDRQKLKRILSKMLDENEFFGPYGIRAISRYHLEHPYEMEVNGQTYNIKYLPAESDTGMFGGNSNWRGPVWMPVNVLLVRALLQYYSYYGDDFKVECPTGSGKYMNLFEVSQELVNRLKRTFLRDEHGRRPVFGGAEKFQNDPNWRDYILFYEYFHGDNGAGIGASHQTGWTGLIAKLIQLYGNFDAKKLLEGGRKAAFTPSVEGVEVKRKEKVG